MNEDVSFWAGLAEQFPGVLGFVIGIAAVVLGYLLRDIREWFRLSFVESRRHLLPKKDDEPKPNRDEKRV